MQLRHDFSQYLPLLDPALRAELETRLKARARSCPIQPLLLPEFKHHRVSVDVLRLDQVDSQLSGNKYFKLQPYLELAKKLKLPNLLSFGGPYSNHIHALAAAAKQHDLSVVGVIRGGEFMTPTLADAELMGMKLEPTSRRQYRDKYQAEFIAKLEQKYGELLLVPEGGGSALGAWGAKSIAAVLEGGRYDSVCLACGTASSFAGILAGVQERSLAMKVVGIPVLKQPTTIKDDDRLEYEVLSCLNALGLPPHSLPDWSLQWGFDCGGYGKCDNKLKQFIASVRADHKLPLDPVYTAKALRGMIELLELGEPLGKRILFVHTGGLQGARG